MGSVITNDARCTRGSISVLKAAFSKNYLFTSKLYFNLRKELVKCHIWNIAFYGAETWTLRKVDQKDMGGFEMWCRGRRRLWTCLKTGYGMNTRMLNE
jgi:hypothetical protein